MLHKSARCDMLHNCYFKHNMQGWMCMNALVAFRWHWMHFPNKFPCLHYHIIQTYCVSFTAMLSSCQWTWTIIGKQVQIHFSNLGMKTYLNLVWLDSYCIRGRCIQCEYWFDWLSHSNYVFFWWFCVKCRKLVACIFLGHQLYTRFWKDHITELAVLGHWLWRHLIK